MNAKDKMPQNHEPLTYAHAYSLHIAEALYAALKPDPFYQAMEASLPEQERKAGLLRYFDYSMQEAEAFGELSLPEREPCGAAVWSRPLSSEQAQEKAQKKKAFIQQFMGQASWECYAQISRFMSSQSQTLIDASWWYLSIVGVHPDLQGQGRGEQLLNTVLQTLDQQSKPVYLESFTPRNLTFYKRLGFREKGRFFEPHIAAEYTLMLRT